MYYFHEAQHFIMWLPVPSAINLSIELAVFRSRWKSLQIWSLQMFQSPVLGIQWHTRIICTHTYITNIFFLTLFFLPWTLGQWEMVKLCVSNEPRGHNKTCPVIAHVKILSSFLSLHIYLPSFPLHIYQCRLPWQQIAPSFHQALLSLNLFTNCCSTASRIIGCFVLYHLPCGSTRGPVAGLEEARRKAAAPVMLRWGAQPKDNRWVQQTARGSARYQWGNYEQRDKQLSRSTSCLATDISHLGEERKNEPPTTDPPPRPPLTKTCLIGAATSVFFGYSRPFSPLPASRCMLYPHSSVISCIYGMKGTKQNFPDLIRKEGEILDTGVCVTCYGQE